MARLIITVPDGPDAADTGQRFVDYIEESAMRSFLADGFTVGLDGDYTWEVCND